MHGWLSKRTSTATHSTPTLLTMPAALPMGEEPFPAGPFNDMLVVEDGTTRVTTGAGTKAMHDVDASATRVIGKAEARTILKREASRYCKGWAGVV